MEDELALMESHHHPLPQIWNQLDVRSKSMCRSGETDPCVLWPKPHYSRPTARLNQLRQSLRELSAVVVHKSLDRFAADKFLYTFQRRVDVFVVVFAIISVLVIKHFHKQNAQLTVKNKNKQEKQSTWGNAVSLRSTFTTE